MPVLDIAHIARPMSPFSIKQGYGVQVADCDKKGPPSAPSVCYDLLLVILAVLFVPPVMLFCVVFLLW
jgi:hypothetical protein